MVRTIPFQGMNTGSNPVRVSRRLLSGQRRWTVNPLSYDFVGSNPTLLILFKSRLVELVDTTVLKTVDLYRMGSSPIASIFILKRCSSMVEHWLHNSGVMGSNPIIVNVNIIF